MGMRPNADLQYGIDIGEFSFGEPKEGIPSDLPWLTLELWQDSYEIEETSYAYLKSQGVEGVSIQNYGHCDRPTYALVSKCLGTYGLGKTAEITAEDLTVTDDDERLIRAWDLLFPGKEHGRIAWRLSATFG